MRAQETALAKIAALEHYAANEVLNNAPELSTLGMEPQKISNACAEIAKKAAGLAGIIDKIKPGENVQSRLIPLIKQINWNIRDLKKVKAGLDSASAKGELENNIDEIEALTRDLEAIALGPRKDESNDKNKMYLGDHQPLSDLMAILPKVGDAALKAKVKDPILKALLEALGNKINDSIPELNDIVHELAANPTDDIARTKALGILQALNQLGETALSDLAPLAEKDPKMKQLYDSIFGPMQKVKALTIHGISDDTIQQILDDAKSLASSLIHVPPLYMTKMNPDDVISVNELINDLNNSIDALIPCAAALKTNPTEGSAIYQAQKTLSDMLDMMDPARDSAKKLNKVTGDDIYQIQQGDLEKHLKEALNLGHSIEDISSVPMIGPFNQAIIEASRLHNQLKDAMENKAVSPQMKRRLSEMEQNLNAALSKGIGVKQNLAEFPFDVDNISREISALNEMNNCADQISGSCDDISRVVPDSAISQSCPATQRAIRMALSSLGEAKLTPFRMLPSQEQVDESIRHIDQELKDLIDLMNNALLANQRDVQSKLKENESRLKDDKKKLEEQKQHPALDYYDIAENYLNDLNQMKDNVSNCDPFRKDRNMPANLDKAIDFFAVNSQVFPSNLDLAKKCIQSMLPLDAALLNHLESLSKNGNPVVSDYVKKLARKVKDADVILKRALLADPFDQEAADLAKQALIDLQKATENVPSKVLKALGPKDKLDLENILAPLRNTAKVSLLCIRTLPSVAKIPFDMMTFLLLERCLMLSKMQFPSFMRTL